jgi:hypothetical protein
MMFQGYFQRILSIKKTKYAQSLSIASMFGCLSLAVPTVMIGVIAQATDWPIVNSFNKTINLDNGNAIVPLVLHYLTPGWVSFVGKQIRSAPSFCHSN